LLFAMGSRRWAAFSFLVNHAALLFVGMAALLASGNTIASSGGSILLTGNYLLVSSLQLDPLHYAVLAFGLSGCAFCHYLFLAQKSASDRVLASALKRLAFNLEDRRGAR
jgi:hypothetical protein